MKPGLILVDIQNDYFSGGRMELVGISEAGQKAGELLSIFRENNWPTFHIQHLSVQPGRQNQLHQMGYPYLIA